LLVAALQLIEKRNLKTTDVSHLLDHPSRRVSEAAIKTLSALEQENCVDRLLDIAEKNPSCRVAAYSSLLKNGGLFAATKIGHHVLNWQNSEDSSERLKATEVIGNTGIKSYFQPLLPLIEDENLEVRKAAIHAAGQVKHTKLIEPLLKNAFQPGFFDHVFRALQHFPPDDFSLISNHIETMDDHESKRKLIRLLSANSGKSSVSTVHSLYALFEHHSSLIRTEVINTLFILDSEEKNHLLLEEEWTNECRSIDHLQQNWLISDLGTGLLADSIKEEIHNKIICLLKLTGLLYQKRLLLKAIDNYQLGNAVQLSNTLEALDLILNRSHRKRLMHILEFDKDEHQKSKIESTSIDYIFTDTKGLFSDWLKAVILRKYFRKSSRELNSKWKEALTNLNSTILNQELAFISSQN
jgi:hypothetical protein